MVRVQQDRQLNSCIRGLPAHIASSTRGQQVVCGIWIISANVHLDRGGGAPVMGLRDKIESRQAIVSVVGLGYVGLPLAVVFAEAGFRVVGIDKDAARVDSINRGESYIQDIPSKVLKPLAIGHGSPPMDGQGASRLSATTDYEVLEEADAVIVCVPTPLGKTKAPDVSYIISAADEIARRLHYGMLIVLESTSYPGTTDELILPRLEDAGLRHERDPGSRALEVGTDFFLAFSPERIDPGRTDWTIANTPKVIGGVTPQCTEVAAALYGCIVQQVARVSSPNVAEMVKLLENTFRATNIALVNEVAIMCDRLGIDVWEVIEAARTKPFGFMPFYPGPGLGGHCIPVDPQYLAWKMKTLDYNARFIQLAEEINIGMPLHWVTKVQDGLNHRGKPVNGASVLVIGVTYKRDVGDIRESPALDIIDELLKRGASVTYHDPYIQTLSTETYRLDSVSDAELDERIAGADCVVIATDHSSYDWEGFRRTSSLIVDTRNALGRARSEAAPLVRTGHMTNGGAS